MEALLFPVVECRVVVASRVVGLQSEAGILFALSDGVCVRRRLVGTGSRGVLGVRPILIFVSVAIGSALALFCCSRRMFFVLSVLLAAGDSTPIALCSVISSNLALLLSRQFASRVRSVSGVVLDTGVEGAVSGDA
jgi:hypothetical protein